MRLRSHQEAARIRACESVDGRCDSNRTVAMVTPGGGKTILASAFAHVLLRAGVIDAVCVLAPRLALARQMEDGFTEPALGLTERIRHADNTPPLLRDGVGYCTTYQSVVADPKVHACEIVSKRYLLVLDEPHHLVDDEAAGWVTKVRPLVEKAKYTLCMSGTMERHDKRRIPFVDYDPCGMPLSDIKYNRSEAIRDGSVIRTEFIYHDGWVKYLADGVEHEVDISKANKEQAEKVIRTFLGMTNYRESLVRRAMDHWLSHCTSYPSRVIVICDSQENARWAKQFIQTEYDVATVLAISDEPDAARVIRQFRKQKRGQVLSTVGMAYEGLDVKDVTHIICLTNIRSSPWLEQAFARATRFDPNCGLSWEKQIAFIFVPDDPLMKIVIEKLRRDEADGIEDRKKRASANAERNNGKRNPDGFLGLEAELSGVGYGSFDGRLSDEMAKLVEQARAEFPFLARMSAQDIAKFITQAGAWQTRNYGKAGTVESISEQEARLRKSAQALTNRLDKSIGLAPGSMNSHVRYKYGKPRDSMNVKELQRVVSDLQTMLDEARNGS